MEGISRALSKAEFKNFVKWYWSTKITDAEYDSIFNAFNENGLQDAVVSFQDILDMLKFDCDIPSDLLYPNF